MSAHPVRERVVRELGDMEARLNGLLRQGGRRILFGRESAVVNEESCQAGCQQAVNSTGLSRKMCDGFLVRSGSSAWRVLIHNASDKAHGIGSGDACAVCSDLLVWNEFDWQGNGVKDQGAASMSRLNSMTGITSVAAWKAER